MAPVQPPAKVVLITASLSMRRLFNAAPPCFYRISDA
jgi:hypothetical protein